MGTKLANLILFLAALIAMALVHFLDKRLPLNMIGALTAVAVVIVLYLIIQMVKDIIASSKESKTD